MAGTVEQRVKTLENERDLLWLEVRALRERSGRDWNAMHDVARRVPVNTDDVSSPPGDAELDAAFGTPADRGEGFVGVVDDDDAGVTVWLCVVTGGAWWYEQLTKAV